MSAPVTVPQPDIHGLLRDPAQSPADREAFAGYLRELTIQTWPWMGLVVAAAALLWWPVDQLVYADLPRVRARFGFYRGLWAGVDIALVVILPRIPFARRHPRFGAGFCGLINLIIAGYSLADLGQGSGMWLSYAFVTPLFCVPLLVPFRARLAWTLAFIITVLSAWLAHPSAHLLTPGVPPVISFMFFTAGLAVFVGHVLFVLLRRSFHLNERVGAQHAAVQAFAAQLEERVAEQTRDIHDLHVAARDARVEQRGELARDLHDGLGQELTSLRLLVGVGRHLHPDDAGVFSELDVQIDALQQGLRGILLRLRPRLVDQGQLVEALRELVDDRRRRSGLVFVLQTENVPVPVPSGLGLALYRAAQEGITNVLRHARATEVHVLLGIQGADLVLEVRDNGLGTGQSEPAGLGARGVRERARALRGLATWSAVEETAASPGTCMVVSIPLPASGGSQ